MSEKSTVDLFQREANNFKGFAVDTQDHTLYYETGSNSEEVETTFVIAHGACASGRYMNLVAQEILDEIPNSKVVVLDLPFHGHSIASVDVKGLTIDDYKKYVLEFVNALKENGELIGTTQWIGWSMGGSLGLLLNIEDGLFDELTLLNSAPYWETIEGVLSLEPFQQDDTSKQAFKGVFLSELTTENEGYANDLSELYEEMSASGAVIKNDFEALVPANYDLRDKLHEVKAKTLIFSGLNDGVALAHLQELMGEKIPNNKLVMVDDTHITVLKPKRVVELVQHIRDFY